MNKREQINITIEQWIEKPIFKEIANLPWWFHLVLFIMFTFASGFYKNDWYFVIGFIPGIYYIRYCLIWLKELEQERT